MRESLEERERLARARARALEGEGEGEGEDSESTRDEKQAVAPCVLIRLCSHWYAASAYDVQKVVAKGAITRVPGRSRHVLGLTLVHDTLIPVVDLAGLTGAVGAPLQVLTEPRLVILGHGDNRVGIVAEEAHGIENLPQQLEGEPDGVIAGETFWNDRNIYHLNIPELVAAGSDVEGHGS